MEDKKNIVIKVKYPTSAKKTERDVHSPVTVTQWNIKRIVLALAGLVLTLVVLFNLFKQEDVQQADVQSSQPVLAEKLVSTPVKPAQDSSNNIKRALLTFKINKNEPIGEIALPMKLSKNKPTSVYYFVEFLAMKGRTVYHEWLLDGEVITRKKINISDDHFRTSSRQLFAYTAKTQWVARVVDEAGQVLTEKTFSVIYE